ncbi:MAG: hypothetical protein ACJ71Z_09680 [Aeromicrobium sp.]
MVGSSATRETVRLGVLGVTVDVALENARRATLARVRAAWHQCLIEPTDVPANVVVDLGPIDDADALLHRLSQEVTLRAIDARAGQLLMLHGAALADATTGATLAVVGPSGMGKSTWLQAHGSGRRYLSDETVAITADLGVVAHAKPISVGNGSLKSQLPPRDLGLRPAKGTERLAGLWLLIRDSSVPARLEPVDMLDALPLLAEHASHLSAMAAPLQALAAVVDGCGGLFRAHYAEAADLAPFVDDALQARR